MRAYRQLVAGVEPQLGFSVRITPATLGESPRKVRHLTVVR
jgi:hypothetical protein